MKFNKIIFGNNSKLSIDLFMWLCLKSVVNCMDLYLLCRKMYDRGHTGTKINYSEVTRMTVCTVNRNPVEYIEHASSLHKKLHFILDTPNKNGNLALRDLNINKSNDRSISCQLYQKSTVTGINLSFLSSAPLQHEKNDSKDGR